MNQRCPLLPRTNQFLEIRFADGIRRPGGREVGPERDREFIDLPTHAAEAGHFTYAVPLGHVPTGTDRMLAKHAGVILEASIQRRPRMADSRNATEQLLRMNSRLEFLADEGLRSEP